MAEQKTISMFQGAFLLLNYCISSSYFGMPYIFFYSGLLAAVPTVIVLFVIVWINSNYLLEVMARAQALEDLKQSEKPVDSDSTSDMDPSTQRISVDSDSTSDMDPSTQRISVTPNFRITARRKFEIPELCEVFFHKYIKYMNIAIMIMYSLIAQWTTATVAGSAWASNIPFHYLGAGEMCTSNAFLHHTLPTGNCLYAYYLSLGLFAVVVIIISLQDLKEQVFIQCLLCALRYVLIVAAIVYCIVRLIESGDACQQALRGNTSSLINVDIVSTVVKFDVRGWVVGTPVILYGYFIHISIATITHPIKQKKYLHWLVLFVPLIAMLSFLSLIVPTLWFRAAIQETVTLNWSTFIRSGNSLPLRIFSTFLVLYPSVDVISTYSTTVHVIVNNIYILIMGPDTFRKPKFKFDRLLKLFSRFIAALVPVLAAFGVSNLIYVVKYAAIPGFIGFLFPFILQIRSIQVCKTKFSQSRISAFKRKSAGQRNRNHLPKFDGMYDPRMCYMTEYSYLVISHPITGWVMVIIWVCLSFIVLSSLFIGPHYMSCQSPVDQL